MKKLFVLLIVSVSASAVDLPTFNSLTLPQKEALQHVALEANRAQTNTVWTARSYYDGVVIPHATNEVNRVLGSYVAQHQATRDASVETNAPLKVIRSRLPEILNSPTKINRIEAILNE